MAKEILDIYIEPNYEYEFNLNFNDSNGTDLEGDYTCYFKCDSIGELAFSLVGSQYELVISEANTALLTSNLEEYAVYVKSTTTSKYDKLLSGRIHIDKKVR